MTCAVLQAQAVALGTVATWQAHVCVPFPDTSAAWAAIKPPSLAGAAGGTATGLAGAETTTAGVLT